MAGGCGGLRSRRGEGGASGAAVAGEIAPGGERRGIERSAGKGTRGEPAAKTGCPEAGRRGGGQSLVAADWDWAIPGSKLYPKPRTLRRNEAPSGVSIFWRKRRM